MTKTALVTGGGGGIGTATSKRLARDGYRVGVLDLNEETAKKTAAQVPGAVALAADVTDEKSMRAALDKFGAVPDVLVNNAGIVIFGPLVEKSLADYRKVVEVNLMGTVVPTWLVAPGMMKRGSGVIINISSIAGVMTGPNLGAYTATKASVAALAAQLAQEFGPHGVRVNAIAPGMIDAGMGARSTHGDADLDARRIAVIPSRRFGTGEDIANTIAFLCSDEGSYINGQTIVVDGAISVSGLSTVGRASQQPTK
jgi:NAD(P)-dependent dehydrogenase (short-subunit alcohol dehydrogenase family)